MSDELKILVVEDEPNDADLVERELRRAGYQFEARRVDNEQDLRRELAASQPDILLSDYTMPSFDGLRALRITRELSPDTPVIIVTGSQNEETAVECMRSGALDYVLKDRLARLAPAVSAALEKARLEREMREAQEALRRSRDYYLTLLETFPALIWRSDINGRCDYVNRTWTEFTGRSLEQELGDGWTQGVHPDDLARCLGTYRDALSGREAFGIEYRLRYNDGSYRWIADLGRPILDLEGRFAGFLGTCFDQQDRVLFEEALTESERRLSLALHSSHIGLWDWNIRTNEIHYSAQWYAQLGYEPGELPETLETWERLTHPEDLREVKARLERYLEEPWPDYKAEFRMRHRSGEWLHIVARATLISDSGGAPVRMLGTHIDVSDLRAATEAISVERERFQTLADNAPFGLMLVEPSGAVSYVNRAFTATFGYSTEDLVDYDGWYRVAFPDPDYRRHVAGACRLAASSHGHGAPVSQAFLVRCASGQDKHVRFVISALPGGQVLLAMEDETARVLAEEREQQAAAQRDALLARLQLLFDALPVAVIVTDLELNVREWNPAATRIFGYSRTEAVGRSAYDLITPSQARPLVDNVLRGLAADRATRVAVHENRTADGRVIVCRWHDSPLLDESGNLAGIIAMSEDITERATAEAARRRMEAAIESTTETVVIVDPKGCIQYVNPAFERLMGIERSVAMGSTHGLFKDGSPLVVGSTGEIDGRLVAGEPWKGRYESIAPQGDTIIEDVVVSPVRNTDGELVNLVVVGRNVTRELSLQEQLAQAQKMEAIGHLAGGVAHDFNNILGIIQASAELLERDLGYGDRRGQRVEEIEKAASRATTLTRQLLAFARRQVLQPQVVRLADVIDDMASMLHRLIGEDIALDISHSDSAGFVLADPGQIEQVVLNLAVNARDAMPQGGTLKVSTSVIDLSADSIDGAVLSPGPYVRLRVADTGIGMSRDVAARIFDPFFSTKPVGKGTGLGLSTVYGIVAQSGGWISVESHEGEGTAFTILLPRVEPPQPEEGAAVLGVVAPAGGSETILLVEDDAALRDITKEILETSGYTVIESGDGWEALRVAESHSGQIDLLLTDVVMPGMSGPELASNVRQTRPGLCVLYASGYNPETALQHGLPPGDAELIEKPYSVGQLRTRVREALDRRERPS